MRELDTRLTRITTWLAGVLAGLIAFSFPLVFFTLNYQSHIAAVEVEAVFNAANVSRLINANPEFWQFEEPRLQELLKDMTETALPELRRIVDAKGRVIVQSFDPIVTPTIMRTAALLDSGNVVGHFEVIRSLRPLLLETAMVSLFGLLLGGLVLVILRVYPLRSLKRALETLANEKERAEVTLQAIGDAVITIDLTGMMLSFNPAAEKIFGYAANEAVGHNIKMLMPEPYRSEHDGTLERYLQGDQARLIGIDHEVTAQRSDGGLFPMELLISEFYLDGRRQLIGSMRDITERQLAELALASTHRALQMLSRTSIAMNRLEDESGLLAEVCRVAVEVGGYRMAWIGYAQDDEKQSIQPMAHAGEEGGYLAAIEVSRQEDHATGQGPAGQAIRSGQPVQSADISRAGNFLWHAAALERGFRSAICLPLRDEKRSFGVLCLYAGEAQDFGAEEVKLLQELSDNLAFGIGSLRAQLERRRSQEVARQAGIKMAEQASLLDRAQDAILVRNLDRTIRFWNQGAERLYGWTADEVRGKTMDELMYPSPQVLMAAMNQTLSNDGDWTGELEQVARDGTPVSIEARWTVVRDEHGQVNGVLGINTDIRERKRAREEILRLNASLEERVQQRTAQLQIANEELQAFSYSVSHDLRTPLSAINGFSNLLSREISAGAASERSTHYLTRIRAGVVQMSELIDALLSLAQLSRTTLRRQKVDLSALAQTILNGFMEREPGRKVALAIAPGSVVEGDPLLLRQVLENLLGNAWKFSCQQPLTHIAFKREIRPDGGVVYAVQDNGAGFDMAYVDKLFGAFQRLHTEAEFAGSGIGLATVRRIVGRHGGEVWGESAPGRGATFYFTLGGKAT